MKRVVYSVLYGLSLAIFLSLIVIAWMNGRFGTILVSSLVVIISTKIFLKSLKELRADKCLLDKEDDSSKATPNAIAGVSPLEEK